MTKIFEEAQVLSKTWPKSKLGCSRTKVLHAFSSNTLIFDFTIAFHCAYDKEPGFKINEKFIFVYSLTYAGQNSQGDNVRIKTALRPYLKQIFNNWCHIFSSEKATQEKQFSYAYFRFSQVQT